MAWSDGEARFDLIVIGVGFDPFERDKKIEENRKNAKKKFIPLKGIKSLLREAKIVPYYRT